MTSLENDDLPLINPVIPNVPHFAKYIESSLRPPTITIVSDSPLSAAPISSLKKSEEIIYHYEPCQVPTPKRIFAKQLSMAAISRQLTVRKFLQTRLGFISNIMCVLGLLGIILMVIENETTFVSINNKDTNVSWLIKLIITITTVILVSLVIYYHYLNLILYATQNSLDHWRVGLTIKRLFLILFEILICAIHPMPRDFPRNWISIENEIKSNFTVSDSFIISSVSPSYIAVDVALGLPMFARLYLICRCIMFHSHLVRDAPSKSLGSINQVPINFTFLIKTYLEQWPARCLIIFCIVMFFIGSWSLRACDYKPTVAKHISMLDSMWLFIITFTTVGYGDITPSTYCGRSIAAIISLFGLLSSALLISVVAQKLQLTRWEKYVHNFVSDIQLTREGRHQAANIIKFAMKIWYLKRKHNRRSYQYFTAHRMLFRSIHILRKIKHEQRKMNDNCLGFVELINIQHYTNSKTKKIAKEVTTMKLTMDEKFTEINNSIHNIQCTLNLLLDKERLLINK